MTTSAMAGTAPSGPRSLQDRRWFVLLAPLAIYGLARALSAAALLWAARFQPATAVLANTNVRNQYFVYAATPADPSYGELMTNWDGQWYQFIATEGYIPASQGVTPQSAWAWAFPPGYPSLAGALMRLTHLPFTVVAPTVSLLLGAAAMVVLYAFLRRQGGTFLAVTGVATTSFFVSAPLLQAAYSESLSLLLVVAVLYASARDRWWLASVLTLALAFVRLITPPLALVGLLAMFRAWRSGARSAGVLAGPAVFSGIALVGPFLWPKVSQALIGSGTVEGADRASGAVEGFGFGWFGAFAGLSPWLVIPLLAVVVLLVRLMSDPAKRYWGDAIRTWGWVYPLFILLVTPPTTGVVRYLLLAFPLGLPLAGDAAPPSRRRVVVLVLACVGLQVLQVAWILRVYIPQSGAPLVP